MSPNFLAKELIQTAKKGSNTEKVRARIQVAKERARPGFFEKLGCLGLFRK